LFKIIRKFLLDLKIENSTVRGRERKTKRGVESNEDRVGGRERE